MHRQDSKEHAGHRLRNARQASGLTQQEVTEALGLVRSTLVRWEADGRVPKESALRTLVDLYQVSEEWIRTGRGEQPLCTAQRRDAAQAYLERLRERPSAALTLGQRENFFTPSGMPRAESELRESRQAPKGQYGSGAHAETLRERLSSISERMQQLLNSRPILPTLPGIHPEVVRAMKEGQVIPTPELMLVLAEKTLVHPHWLLTGGDQWVLPMVEPSMPEQPLGETDASSAPPEKHLRAKRSRR